ncbi:tyrosinase [Rubrobacter xylanophilus DSM 9941]|uniref:Tyrosinase n=1 Tax=Rubrobacter xylanophilus (strain DSM 9941 / JCM 11954 / NBRC 16129 / PRD-1) TaxID=266117 RepID=Q1AUN4_RUBXD|nr:tyrosinase [Rubrobacter xylanophilus DSM 9941]
MGVRKNQARLTAAERAAFVRALKVLKAEGIYDMHVSHHRTAVLSMDPDPAHIGPAFFPWHRECLRRFELDLQKVDPTVTIPYWDFVADGSPSSSIWADDFMGGNGRALDSQVMTGPFAYSTGEWTLTVNDNRRTPPYLRRAFGVRVSTLPTGTQVNGALRRVTYDAAPWNATVTGSYFRSFCEKSLHNRVHNWVGGTMLQGSSPNDPVFWMLHCFMDRLWARWRRRYPDSPYLPSSGGPVGHNLNDPMWPWAAEPDPPTPAKVLDHRQLGYTYDDEASW